ncbi:hypothetical protein ACWIUD_04820 [Helicobacter sp. 23-1044]
MDTYTILGGIQDRLPRGEMRDSALNEIKSRLDSLSDSQRSDVNFKIQALNLKNPALVFWVGSFLFGNFGVGRFMIGDIGLGIARLILPIIGLLMMASGFDAVMVIGTICYSGSIVWWFVDLFIVGKKLRMQNLRKVILAIESVKGR